MKTLTRWHQHLNASAALKNQWGVAEGWVCRNSRCSYSQKMCVCPCARQRKAWGWVGGDAPDSICAGEGARRWPGPRDWSLHWRDARAVGAFKRCCGRRFFRVTSVRDTTGAERSRSPKRARAGGTNAESCVFRARGNFSCCVAAGCWEPGAQQVSCRLLSLTMLLCVLVCCCCRRRRRHKRALKNKR